MKTKKLKILHYTVIYIHNNLSFNMKYNRYKMYIFNNELKYSTNIKTTTTTKISKNMINLSKILMIIKYLKKMKKKF